MEDHETLISAESLAGSLAEPALRVVDCRFNLLQPEAGRQAYDEAHIPGAVYAHLDDDLAGPVTATSGRHPLPPVESAVSFFGGIGIDTSTQVVVYDEMSGAIAARAWWLLRWLGHRRVAVLDGGIAAWKELGLPMESRAVVPEPKGFRATLRPGMIIETSEILASLADPAELRLIDARDGARFRGEQEPIDAVAGHIPGAINLPFAENLGDGGRWKGAAGLQAIWSDTLPGAPEAPFSVMCGSGVTACHLVLSSQIAGRAEPRVYVGSWSEWIRDPDRPVATGGRPDHSGRVGGFAEDA